MCGIYFSCSRDEHVYPSDYLRECLRRRGPDSVFTTRRAVKSESASPQDINSDRREQSYFLTFLSTVLSLRGEGITRQPQEDPDSGSLLCWNGEAWKNGDEIIDGNDSQAVFELFLKAIRPSEPGCDHAAYSYDQNMQCIIGAIASISGPYAFVFYDAPHQRIFFGRDALGRRSLAIRSGLPGNISVSSICGSTDIGAWTEVEADGVYMLDLRTAPPSPNDVIQPILFIPRLRENSDTQLQYILTTPFPVLNNDSEGGAKPPLTLEAPAVGDLLQKLQYSMHLRIRNILMPPSSTPNSARVAVLFSGGLDCTVLARLAHEVLPKEQEIDLLNVAFENPRVIQAAGKKGPSHERSAYGLCPDRITGLTSYAELQSNCPGRRWRFVAVDVPYLELQSNRSNIISLIYPHNTEMDFSIACALFFAARGSGATTDLGTSLSMAYNTPARILLSGLGADELFGGYTRHATAFRRRGYAGLTDELQLDFDRLGKRNLGRDDRVISHWGKEVRYPYLDEDLVSWALSIPVWEKSGFGHHDADQGNSSLPLEPGKKLLRLLAWRLGLQGAAAEKKRAIQFGARTAKMEAGKTKGTQPLS